VEGEGDNLIFHHILCKVLEFLLSIFLLFRHLFLLLLLFISLSSKLFFLFLLCSKDFFLLFFDLKSLLLKLLGVNLNLSLTLYLKYSL
jgi:hypothetical protein